MTKRTRKLKRRINEWGFHLDHEITQVWSQARDQAEQITQLRQSMSEVNQQLSQAYLNRIEMHDTIDAQLTQLRADLTGVYGQMAALMDRLSDGEDGYTILRNANIGRMEDIARLSERISALEIIRSKEAEQG